MPLATGIKPREGSMKVVSIKEQKDGSAIMTYDLDPSEIPLLKAEAKRQKKRFSTKFINEVVLSMLEEGMAREKAELDSAPKTKKTKRKK
jgi:hypothetical protein